MHTQARRHRLALGTLLGLAACTTTDLPGIEQRVPLAAASTHAPEPSSALASSEWADATSLVRGEGHLAAVAEVWLDPEAGAALSLDTAGEVRLWPALAGEADALEPIVLPIVEPARLSFSRTASGSFLIAVIDMAQLGRVLEVRRGASGAYEAIERMRFAVDEPLFELHVLPGGERVLALGVDHRLRLFDRSGALLDELAEHGLAPWQLRLVGRADTLAAAVVLAQPTRVQRLSLADDHLQLVGEARRIYNDRGPNLNDLQLLPTGTHATAFRRPSAKGKQWTLELIDLASGEVRVMRGEVESRIRPRLHVVDERRALLEDGSGQGYWIDLRGGVVMPPDFVLPEDIDDLPAEALVTTQRIPLAGSIERERWHASIVEGVRAAPRGRGILIDPIDDAEHRVLAHRSLGATALAFGEAEIAWALPQGRVVESLATPGLLRPLEPASAASLAWSEPALEPASVGGLTFTAMGSRGIEQRSADGTTTMIASSGYVMRVAASPDARWLAVVEGRKGRVAQASALVLLAQDGREVWRAPLESSAPSIAWSPSGELIGVADDWQALVLTRDGELLLERHHGGVELVAGSDVAVGEREIAAWREQVRLESSR